jgi:hypothetical protein
MEAQKNYKGKQIYKYELAAKYGIHKDTLIKDLEPIKDRLPYFFSTKKYVLPIEHAIICNHLGWYE